MSKAKMMRLAVASAIWLALISAGAQAASTFVGPIQTYSCTNQVATALVSGTAATTCSSITAAYFATGTQGQVLNSPSSTTYSFTAAPVLGVASTAAGTLGLASGTTSGVVQIENTGATSSWHLDLPATGGASNGQVMTWQGVDTPMTWTTPGGGSAALTITPVSAATTLTSANDKVVYTTGATAVSFNLTGSVVAGDNWCFEQAGTGAVTVAANSVAGMVITMGTNAGTTATGTLVSGGQGSALCLWMQTATAAAAYTATGAWTNN